MIRANFCSLNFFAWWNRTRNFLCLLYSKLIVLIWIDKHFFLYISYLWFNLLDRCNDDLLRHLWRRCLLSSFLCRSQTTDSIVYPCASSARYFNFFNLNSGTNNWHQPCSHFRVRFLWEELLFWGRFLVRHVFELLLLDYFQILQFVLEHFILIYRCLFPLWSFRTIIHFSPRNSWRSLFPGISIFALLERLSYFYLLLWQRNILVDSSFILGIIFVWLQIFYLTDFQIMLNTRGSNSG